MNPNIERLKLIFIGLFVALCIGVGVWQVGWIIPQRKCEQAHKWWDGGQRVCATPVLISDITGRTLQDRQAAAEARAAIGPSPQPQ